MARPKMDEDKRSIKQSISIKPDMLPILIKFCQDEERTMSWVIDKALRQYFEKMNR